MTEATCASTQQLYVSHMRTGSIFLHQIRVLLLAAAMIFGLFGTAAQASDTSSMATMEMSFASASLATDTTEDCTGCSMDADMSSVCHSSAGCQAIDLVTSGDVPNGSASAASVTPVDALARGLAIRPLAQPPKSIIV